MLGYQADRECDGLSRQHAYQIFCVKLRYVRVTFFDKLALGSFTDNGLHLEVPPVPIAIMPAMAAMVPVAITMMGERDEGGEGSILLEIQCLRLNSDLAIGSSSRR